MVTSREKLELQRRTRLKVMLEEMEKQSKRLDLTKAREKDDLSNLVLDLGDAENPEPKRDELDEEFVYEDSGPDACSKCFGTKEIKACERCGRKLCMDHMDSHACASMREGDVIHADFKNKKRLPDVEQKVQEEMARLQQKYPIPTSLHLRNKFYMASPKELVDEAWKTLGEIKIEKIAEDVFNASDDLSGLEIPGSKGGSIEKMDLEQEVWEKMFKLQQKYDYLTAGELADELIAQAPDLSDRVFNMLDNDRLEELAQDVIESSRGASFGDDREPPDSIAEIVGPSDVAVHGAEEHAIHEEELEDEDPDDLISMLDSIMAEKGGDINDALELIDALKADHPEKWEEVVDKHEGDEEAAFDEVMDAANIALGNPAEEEYDDSMDGDAETALASAGLGTDEDYGDFGGDDDWGMDEGRLTNKFNKKYKNLAGLTEKVKAVLKQMAYKLSVEDPYELVDLYQVEYPHEHFDEDVLLELAKEAIKEKPAFEKRFGKYLEEEDMDEDTSRQKTWKRARARKKGMDEAYRSFGPDYDYTGHGREAAEEDTPSLEPAPWKGEFDLEDDDEDMSKIYPNVPWEECECCASAKYSNEDCMCPCHDSSDEELDEGSWSDIELSDDPLKKKRQEPEEDKTWSDIEMSEPKKKPQQTGAWSDLKPVGKGRIR